MAGRLALVADRLRPCGRWSKSCTTVDGAIYPRRASARLVLVSVQALGVPATRRRRTMQGSEDGRRWRAPLSVAVATLALPLGLLGSQVVQLLPPPDLPPPDPPPPVPTIVAEQL